MPRIKRLIQWEGDPNLLPNREKKTNIVYKDKSARFNPESIRKALTSKDEVLLLFASLSYYDKELTKLKDGTTYKLNKTWEDLGLQDLYEEYLKSK